jgi:hypothetical protein
MVVSACAAIGGIMVHRSIRVAAFFGIFRVAAWTAAAEKSSARNLQGGQRHEGIFLVDHHRRAGD